MVRGFELMPRKQDYREGAGAREAFDSTMKALFLAPKTVSMSRPNKKRKPKASASDRASNASPKED